MIEVWQSTLERLRQEFEAADGRFPALNHCLVQYSEEIHAGADDDYPNFTFLVPLECVAFTETRYVVWPGSYFVDPRTAAEEIITPAILRSGYFLRDAAGLREFERIAADASMHLAPYRLQPIPA